MPVKTPALRAKRAFDVVVAGAGLGALAPLLGGLVLLELVFHGWPPFFVQERPGLHGRVFRMVKFRTMTAARDAQGRLLPDAQRLTPFGKLLRSTSLDELPELWNVLRGEMSLVGPRPLLVEYLDRYSPEQMRRHEMPPGITGLAQVRGRNALSWPEKFALDVEYVDRWSLALDARILAATVMAVLRREGISAPGEATMPVFMGETAEHG
jgi:lipopolysaccharide/colanic/teichoic acid biosynthesis glycosyltransferase